MDTPAHNKVCQGWTYLQPMLGRRRPHTLYFIAKHKEAFSGAKWRRHGSHGKGTIVLGELNKALNVSYDNSIISVIRLQCREVKNQRSWSQEWLSFFFENNIKNQSNQCEKIKCDIIIIIIWLIWFVHPVGTRKLINSDILSILKVIYCDAPLTVYVIDLIQFPGKTVISTHMNIYL